MGFQQFQVGDKALTVFELDDLCDSATGRALTGAWVWHSALVLAETMTSHSRLGQDQFPIFFGKSVIELGAGAGLPGLTAALLGASRVVLTDVGALLPGLRKNVEANGLGDRVEVRELVWGSEESLSIIGEFDVVLMSDVFFDAEEMAALGRTLRTVCRRRGTVILAATEVRPWTAECLSELEKEGFGIVELVSGLGSSVEGNEGMELGSSAVYSLASPDEEDGHVATLEL